MATPEPRDRSALTLGCGAVALFVAILPCLSATLVWRWSDTHPCWRYSGAAWCGHFCDDDPCACPDRALGPSAYGAGPGCAAP